MKVSVITVCFNSAKTIRASIDSVLSQDYPDLEYIVIDGGSTDGTLEIIQESLQGITRFVSEHDRGIYDAMNKGIYLASGDVVGMLNSDDVYTSPSSISELINAMVEGGTDSVFADLVYVTAKNPNKVIRYYDSSNFQPYKFRFGWMPAHPTFFVKKTAYDLVGPYSLGYKISSDYEMLIRMLYVHNVSYTYLKKVVIKMMQGGTSTSGISRVWLLNREIVRACKENGIYTNMVILALKLPLKFYGLIFKKKLYNQSI